MPTAHGFQEYWGYLYHLDAMQQVSFPDINTTPTEQGVAPPCKNTPIPGVPEVPGAVDPKTTLCLTPPRPVLWCKSSDGTEKNQTCRDEGPLTLERSKTVDEEISAKVVDFLDRNDPKKTNKPFFVWYNPARMHVMTVLSPKYEAMLGDHRRQGLGRQRSRHEADGRQHRLSCSRSSKTWASSTTPSSSSPPTTGPRRSLSPMAASPRSRARRVKHWEGGYRAPMVIRWPGVIKPGTVKNQLFAALDWVPTLVDIAGGAKGDALKKQIEAGQYPGIVKTTLDGVNQRDYLEGKSEKSARDFFFYYLGRDSVGGALQELEDVLHHVAARAGRLDHAARSVPLHPGAEHQA